MKKIKSTWSIEWQEQSKYTLVQQQPVSASIAMVTYHAKEGLHGLYLKMCQLIKMASASCNVNMDMPMVEYDA